MEAKTKSKHYAPVERSLFLQILKKYKDIIECKKSNSSTLREKEVAWRNIVEEFNNSSLITQERSIQQLKKLWTNLKESQREILTKEKQAIFATGRGPETSKSEIDPEVALIAPTLMATAPILFSCNMDDDEVENQKQMVQNATYENMIDIEDILEEEKENLLLVKENKEIIADMPVEARKTIKKRKFMETEEEVKMIRIKKIIEQEQQLAEVKLKHEETMAAIKETHLKEMNKLELRSSSAKAELAKLILKKERNNI